MKKQSKHETTLGIVSSLMSLTKGHERYPHDTVKIDGFPISYKDVENLAKRIKNAYRHDYPRQCEHLDEFEKNYKGADASMAAFEGEADMQELES